MKKLEISDSQLKNLELLRQKLQNVLIEDGGEEIYGGYCYEQCKVTCAYACEALCDGSCMNEKINATCATINN